MTQTGDIVGTLRYLPPEAFEGHADKHSDIYSLGLTLYELLAFQPAFAECGRHRLIKRVTTEEPPRLDKLNRSIPRDLVTIVHKAIDRESAHRYQTAGGLCNDRPKSGNLARIGSHPASPICHFQGYRCKAHALQFRRLPAFYRLPRRSSSTLGLANRPADLPALQGG